MYRYLVTLFVALGFCSSSVFALNTAELANKVENAARQATQANKDVMNDNLLLTVDFTERAYMDAELSPSQEYLTLYAPDFKIVEENNGYRYNKIFKYEANENEKNAEYDEEYDKYVVYSDEYDAKRKLLKASAYYTGMKQTPVYDGTIGCKTYALSSQWVITSASCPIASYDPSPIEHYGETYPHRIDRKIASININGKKINNPKYFLNDHVLLVYIPKANNSSIISLLSGKKKLKVVGFTAPQNLFALNASGEFYVHTSRGGFMVTDKTKATLKGSSLRGSQFQAKSSFNGTATDPFFYVQGNNEFLTAYSSAPLRYSLITNDDNIFQFAWDGKASDKYTALNVDDLKFIKNTILKVNKASWNFIQYRLFVDSPKTLFK